MRWSWRSAWSDRTRLEQRRPHSRPHFVTQDQSPSKDKRGEQDGTSKKTANANYVCPNLTHDLDIFSHEKFRKGKENVMLSAYDHRLVLFYLSNAVSHLRCRGEAAKDLA